MNIPKYSELFIQIVRETSCPRNICPGVIVRETSCTENSRRVRARRRPGNVFPGKWLFGKRPLPCREGRRSGALVIAALPSSSCGEFCGTARHELIDVPVKSDVRGGLLSRPRRAVVVLSTSPRWQYPATNGHRRAHSSRCRPCAWSQSSWRALLSAIFRTKALQPVATCRQSPYLRPALATRD